VSDGVVHAAGCAVWRAGPELPSTSYEVDAGRKVVRYWAMRATGGSFEPNHEVDEVRWVTPGEAARLLDHDHDRHVIEALLPATRRA
jgi:hypothetical protein